MSSTTSCLRHGSRKSPRRREALAPPSPAPEVPLLQAAEEARDWAELPRDIVLDIFLRLGPHKVMLGAEFACRPWRRVALEEPSLWRRVGMREKPWLEKHHRWRPGSVVAAMKLVALDRAAGQCQVFEGDCDDEDLPDLVARAPSLKCLHIQHYSDMESGEHLVEALMKLTLLEELQINFTYVIDWYKKNMLQSICQACPHLKKLVLIYVSGSELECNEDEYSKEKIDGEIPMMLNLHTLELYECGLSGKGLKAILDSCPLLETLHIDGYFDKTEMDKELLMKCAMVKNLTLPTRNWNDIYNSQDEDDYSDTEDEDYTEDEDDFGSAEEY